MTPRPATVLLQLILVLGVASDATANRARRQCPPVQ
jgi:hypothetical protein